MHRLAVKRKSVWNPEKRNEKAEHPDWNTEASPRSTTLSRYIKMGDAYLNKKIQRQVVFSLIRPPTIGPKTVARTRTMPI